MSPSSEIKFSGNISRRSVIDCREVWHVTQHCIKYTPLVLANSCILGVTNLFNILQRLWEITEKVKSFSCKIICI